MKTPRILLTLALLLSCKAFAFTPVLPVQAGTNGVIISPTNFLTANGLITTNGVPLSALPLAVVTNGESYTNLTGYPFLTATNSLAWSNVTGAPNFVTNALTNAAAFDTNGAATAVSNSLSSSLTNYTLKSTLSVLATNTAFAGLTALPTSLAGYGITNAVVTNGSSITNLTGYNVVVTNGATVLTNGSSLPWASVTGSPTSLSGYGITNAIVTNGSSITNLTGYNVVVTNGATVLTNGSSLPWASVTGSPTSLSGYGITNAVTNGSSITNLTGFSVLATNTAFAGLTALPATLAGHGITNAVTNGSSITNLTAFSVLATNTAFAGLTALPATLAGHGITNAVTNGSSITNLTGYSVLATNTAFAGLTALPATLAGHGITNAVTNGSSITNLTGYNVVVTNGATVLTNGSLLPWASVTGSPTSLSGYGITNAVTNGSSITNLTGLSALATNASATNLTGINIIVTNTAATVLTNGGSFGITLTNSNATASVLTNGLGLTFSGYAPVSFTKGLSGTSGSFGEANELLLCNSNSAANVINLENDATNKALATMTFRAGTGYAGHYHHEMGALGLATLGATAGPYTNDLVFLELSDIDNPSLTNCYCPPFVLLQTTSYGGTAPFGQYQRLLINSNGDETFFHNDGSTPVLTIGTNGIITLSPTNSVQINVPLKITSGTAASPSFYYVYTNSGIWSKDGAATDFAWNGTNYAEIAQQATFYSNVVIGGSLVSTGSISTLNNYITVHPNSSGGAASVQLKSDQLGSGRNVIMCEQSDASLTFTFYGATSNITALQLQENGVANFSSNVVCTSLGSTFSVKSGTNGMSGTVILASGSGTVTSSAILSNDVITTSLVTTNGTPSVYALGVKVSNGSAVFTGAATDSGTYNWIGIHRN